MCYHMESTESSDLERKGKVKKRNKKEGKVEGRLNGSLDVPGNKTQLKERSFQPGQLAK